MPRDGRAGGWEFVGCESPAMKKFHTVLLGLGVALFAYLLSRIGVGELWRELGLLGWGLVPLMLGEGIAEMVHTLGWRHCLSGPLKSLSWATLFRIRMAGYAINYLTPTAALGGELTKGVLLAAHHRGPEAASGVLIGKVCFAVSHLTFVTLGALLVVWRLQMPRSLWTAMLVCGGLLAAGIITFLLLQSYGKLGAILRWFAARYPNARSLQSAAQHLTAVDDTMVRFYRERPTDFLFAISWHLIGYSIGIAQTWLFFHLLHHDTTLSVIAGTWFLGMWFDLLTFAVPQNLGTLEATRIIMLRAIGYTALMGMTYGFAQRLAQIFWACFGLINHALLASRTGAPGIPSEDFVQTATPRAHEKAPEKASAQRANKSFWTSTAS
jgi:uncharacterized protein (TIRG00374 family)